ncbi:hypothetical protein PASE110613_07600 [Paenibacillus sediminis]|uniref:Lipid-A-disaccharide synthase-like uncharacterized protein n=1 Tax=Paenibacillus sediminis TaxID=664909 RepID=A0ABS4H2N9_9BACL|nr:hypothetical protein [Paenibacillus sediminis]MBP1936795.1 lipid-A-disaccharide synthase-like uncharacterized protein [Paenibacillus sediminis]
MSRWWNLFREELLIESRKSAFAMMSVIGLVIAGLSLFFAYRYHTGGVSYLWLAIIYLQVLVPTIYMISSLHKEKRRSPLWLQLPLSGWELISVKYAVTFVQTVVGLAASIGMFFWVYQEEKSGIGITQAKLIDFDSVTQETQYLSNMLHGQGIASGLYFLFIAFSMSVIFVLMYVIAWALKHRLGSLRYPAAFIIMAVVVGLESIFELTPVYASLFDWGTITIIDSETFSWGELLWMGINIAACLYVISWLLDKKVEV